MRKIEPLKFTVRLATAWARQRVSIGMYSGEKLPSSKLVGQASQEQDPWRVLQFSCGPHFLVRARTEALHLGWTKRRDSGLERLIRMRRRRKCRRSKRAPRWRDVCVNGQRRTGGEGLMLTQPWNYPNEADKNKNGSVKERKKGSLAVSLLPSRNNTSGLPVWSTGMVSTHPR